MKRYCFDTSGVSNPLEAMPEDIHSSMRRVVEIFEAGAIAVTSEIYHEMTDIPGAIGTCINAHKGQLLLEVIIAPEAKKRRIPNICQAESVEHLDFNAFLRREGWRFSALQRLSLSCRFAVPRGCHTGDAMRVGVLTAKTREALFFSDNGFHELGSHQAKGDPATYVSIS